MKTQTRERIQRSKPLVDRGTDEEACQTPDSHGEWRALSEVGQWQNDPVMNDIRLIAVNHLLKYLSTHQPANKHVTQGDWCIYPHMPILWNGTSLAQRLCRRISTVMFTSRWAWPARWPICPIFWLLGKQSSQTFVIPCLGRRWTTEQNVMLLALSSVEKSVSVSPCVDN